MWRPEPRVEGVVETLSQICVLSCILSSFQEYRVAFDICLSTFHGTAQRSRGSLGGYRRHGTSHASVTGHTPSPSTHHNATLQNNNRNHHIVTLRLHRVPALHRRLDRPKKKMNLMNEQRIKAFVSRFDSGSYTRFSSAPWVTASACTLTLCPDESSCEEDDADDLPSATTLPAAATGTTSTSVARPTAAADWCEVCLIGQRDGVALVPCGHARFRSTCVDRVVSMVTGCTICRADIQMVMGVCN